MAEFADLLSPQLPAPPPPPRGGFADILAAGFGAGPDRMGAYQQGLDSGSQYRLRTAQTESALAEAEKRRAEAMGQSQLNDAKAKAYADPNFVPNTGFYAMLATGANDLANARLGDQELGFRGLLGDVNAAPEAQFAAGQGVQGKVLPRMEAVGGQTYNLATDPNMQAPTMTPMQQAQLNAENALERQRDRPPAGAVGGLGKPPSGFRWTADGQLEFIPGGPQDPNRPKAAPGDKPLTEFQVKTLSQLSRMDRTEQILNSPEFQKYSPSLADVAMDAVPGVGNYAVSKEYQQYKQLANEWISGLLRLDSGAAVPETEFKRYFVSFFPQPGDGPDTVEQKAAARAAATSALRSGVPGIAATIDASRAPVAAPSAAPTGGEPAPKTQAEYDALPPGTVYVDTDGKRKRKR